MVALSQLDFCSSRRNSWKKLQYLHVKLYWFYLAQYYKKKKKGSGKNMTDFQIDVYKNWENPKIEGSTVLEKQAATRSQKVTLTIERDF